MRISAQHRRDALSLIDVIIVIATLASLVTFFLIVKPFQKAQSRSPRITCRNNLKQVALSFQIWAGDNNDKYPNQVSTNDGGLMEIAFSSDVFRYFQILSNELGTPKVICCPSDTRYPAKDFSTVRNTNVSYFLGIDAAETNPTMLLAGDRNVQNGLKPNHGMLELNGKQKIRFTKEIHREVGNIVLVDGSVQEVTGKQLRTMILPKTGFATNRILLP